MKCRTVSPRDELQINALNALTASEQGRALLVVHLIRARAVVVHVLLVIELCTAPKAVAVAPAQKAHTALQVLQNLLLQTHGVSKSYRMRNQYILAN